jgi:hypothetical protein
MLRYEKSTPCSRSSHLSQDNSRRGVGGWRKDRGLCNNCDVSIECFEVNFVIRYYHSSWKRLASTWTKYNCSLEYGHTVLHQVILLCKFLWYCIFQFCYETCEEWGTYYKRWVRVRWEETGADMISLSIVYSAFKDALCAVEVILRQRRMEGDAWVLSR